MRGPVYSVDVVPVEPGTEVRPGVRSWARYVLRAETAPDRFLSRSVDSLDDLRRRVRRLRARGFRPVPPPRAALVQTFRSGRDPVVLVDGPGLPVSVALDRASDPVPGLDPSRLVLPGVVLLREEDALRPLVRGEEVEPYRVLSRTESV